MHAILYVMRKSVFLIVFLLMCSISMMAQRYSSNHDDNYHFGYISAAAGYSSLSQNISNVTTKGGFAPLVGAGYEFRMHGGWCSVGVQFAQHSSTTTPGEYTYIPRDADGNYIGGIDDQQKRILYYQYTIRQVDKQVWHSVDIPIMAGYYNSGFYVGAGLKVGFSVASSITTSGEYSLAAQYERYHGMFKDMPQHYLGTYPVEEQKYDCTLRPQFAIIGDIGYDLLSSMQTSSKVCHMLKIGFYFEAGVRSVRPNDSYYPIQEQGITPYYLSTQTQGKFVAPYFVGLKLTYLIGGSRSSTGTWHKGCQCYGN